LCDNELKLLLDSLIPAVKTITCRQRPSDPWFDPECRQAKCQVRHLERRDRANNSTDATAEWMKERRAYRSLLQSKREQYWTQKIESEKSSPRQLWSSIDALLGCGVTPSSDKIDAEQLH